MNSYKRELLKSLKEAIPQWEVDVFTNQKWEDGDEDFYFAKIQRRKVKRGFLLFTFENNVSEEKKLANFRLINSQLLITICHPVFLRACNTTLNELSANYKSRMEGYEVRYDYYVE